ncbi:MAG: HAMP domain-containing histidine kinase, partial [Candidatus Omnitrophica bacterium]|nr:HAMP domain-containing histidine kinase [Candidatus Omnitrophota bacterium]
SAFFIAMGLSYVLAGTIVHSTRHLTSAAKAIAGGRLESRVPHTPGVKELTELTSAFNHMAEKLAKREEELALSHRQVSELNKSYLDLIGFVTHELKGVLASTTMNLYTLQMGYLGATNFKQRKALDSVARNLDYLTTMVHHFLNLSRIEQGELDLGTVSVDLKAEVFEDAIDNFKKNADDKHMTIENAIPQGTKVLADPDLLRVVANNLVGNAVKYGRDGGRVRISAQSDPGTVTFEVYNDGEPLSPEDCGKLFKKFSRAVKAGSGIKGTGLGLFITREIIEKHGGTITVLAREAGNAFLVTLNKEA